MKKCVIIGAAKIQNYERLKKYLSSEDFYIFCDGGLAHQKSLEVQPHLIVGDFDSWTGELPADNESARQNPAHAQIIRLPTEKDDTDLFYAAKYALAQGFTDFLILGAIGQRFDHSLCNISLLLYLFKNGKKALLVDDFSEMQIIGQVTSQQDEARRQAGKDVLKDLFIEKKLPCADSAGLQRDDQNHSFSLNIPGRVPDTFSFFSLMCVSGRADGVTIKNAKYPLSDASIQPEWQYAVSNQVLPGKTAEITVKSGQLLLIKDF